MPAASSGDEGTEAAQSIPATTLSPSPLITIDSTITSPSRQASVRSVSASGSNRDLNNRRTTGAAPLPSPTTPVLTVKPTCVRSDTEAAMNTGIRRRITRAGTFRTVDDFQEFTSQPGWHPGAEPGVDPTKPDGGHGSMPILSTRCEITVVDFSQEDLSIRKLDNETLPGFLEQPQPDWARCRWINVNGLSWDVIQALGRYKNLHRLAIEDIMNTRNRTKSEWYPTHAFIILTLLKLVHLYDSDSEESDWEDGACSSRSSGSSLGARWPRRLLRKLRRAVRSGGSNEKSGGLGDNSSRVSNEFGVYLRSQSTGFSDNPDFTTLRTLQRYHAASNSARVDYMEQNSALASRHLAVACEQVSLFLTNDNCIISFFEQSAQDIEIPIIHRLQTIDTIIRQSCDASMLGQAIIDGIIDLAIPVVACYSDVIGDLELDVLNRPTIEHTKKLYILVSEIHKILALINPITALINTLRDHETDVAQEAIMAHLLDPDHGVIITHLTYTYLGDILDHCVLITETLNQLKASAEGMIDLIFNTISAYQNESMKQLTIATIIFLPLTFLTGYFGQNFEHFDDLEHGVSYFWKIAIPVVVFTILVLLWEVIRDYLRSLIQKRRNVRLKRRLRKRMMGRRQTRVSR
ncbi:hypothetical protein VTJ83DRAFT_1322 [Remersonia thermophila]|uniref:Uncharacterized protein n=1 Tax=Remersonia thermophila TaxID=72144 RepID=A0ABR4DNP8_9PEZI